MPSSFFPKFSVLIMNGSSLRVEYRSQPKIKPNSSLAKFHPRKKLVRHFVETFKNPPSLQQVITPHMRNQESSLEAVFKFIDEFACKFIDLSLHPSIDPKQVLSGNYAPVEELPPTSCDVVEGSLPSCLDGVYIRNGPNPQFIPRGPYHLYDGDGMLHSVKISQGKASFCSRFVKTYKYKVESEIGYPIIPSIFASFNGFIPTMASCILIAARVLTGQINPMIHGMGGANTSLALIGGKLFALAESDLPYAIKVTPDGDIITLDRHDFYSSKPFMRMTAHPKFDQNTKETFGYTYDLMHPFLTFFRIDSDGRKQEDVPILSMERSSLIHDFGVTKNYAIFPEIQILLNPMEIVRGRSPVIVDPTKIPRLGIIPKYAEDDREMWWIDVPGFNMLHCVNAWEEDGGDTIVMVASNWLSIEHALENLSLACFRLEKITINVKAKTLLRHPLSTKNLEMAVVNPTYAGKTTRYVYAAVASPNMLSGVVKLDLSLTGVDHGDCTVACRLYGPGCHGGEAFFVPNNSGVEEDDGYLVTYVVDVKTKESQFLVMDAKSPSLDIIAAVKLPHVVPSGFHGLFVSQAILNKL